MTTVLMMTLWTQQRMSKWKENQGGSKLEAQGAQTTKINAKMEFNTEEDAPAIQKLVKEVM
eukprot:10240844-Ditylum_brightwellii.AAC.1